jgi:hypothetical protein
MRSYLIPSEGTYESRNEALAGVVPRIVAMTTAKGRRLRGFAGYSVELHNELLVSSDPESPSKAVVSVHAVIGNRMANVFLAHAFGFATANNSTFIRHSGSRVGVIKLSRGEWEDWVIASEAMPPLPLEALLLQHHSRLRPYRDDAVDAPVFAAHL